MPKAPYHRIRGLEKGLAVLRALGTLGESSVAAVAAAVEVPRPTAHRILETLAAVGYVAKGRVRGTYRLTIMVRSLSEGYRDAHWVTDISDPVLRDLAEEIVWPIDIATYADGAMVIRTSTHARSPMSLHGAITGASFPMLSSSVGLTYLAFCPAPERAAILELLSRGDTPDGQAIRAGFDVARALDETRRRGYGLRQGSRVTRTSSIAVPVMTGDRVLASLCVVWMDAVMTVDIAVRRCLDGLQRAARSIEARYDSAQDEGR